MCDPSWCEKDKHIQIFKFGMVWAYMGKGKHKLVIDYEFTASLESDTWCH